MTKSTYQVLLVEDDPSDAALTQRFLAKSRDVIFDVVVAPSIERASELLSLTVFDAVLLDLSLPDSEAGSLEPLAELHGRAPETAFVVLTGMDDDEIALQAMRRGAQDYLRKRDLSAPWLERALRYAVERNRAEVALTRSENRYALAARGTNDGIWDWDLVTDTVYYSPRWKAMLGFEEAEISQRPDEWLNRVHPEDLQKVKAELDLHFGGHAPHFQSEHRVRHASGDYRWVVCRGLAVRDSSGRNVRVAGSLRDITLRKEVEQQLQHDALHDVLTGLANRTLLRDRLGLAIARARRQGGQCFAVLFLDLDRFKNVNDSLGHLVGDQLLIQIAHRLEAIVRPGDTVARLGGDEFAILADFLQDPNPAKGLARRIEAVLEKPFEIEGHEIFASASIGISVDTGQYTSPEVMLRDADTAMYRAKLQGSGRFEVFDPTMHDTAVRILQLENDLQRGMEREEFHVRYQPIVSLADGRLTGFEALLRWRHPRRGVVYPDEFVAVAEETGLIVPLGEWVLTEACTQMAEWRRGLPTAPGLVVSVNLSTRQFRQSDLVARVCGALESARLEPDGLCLEITESMLMQDTESAIAKLTELRGLGVQIHIDDFGTGYSSLSYLHSLPTDVLKIDRSFVSGLGTRPHSAEIVSTIVALARKLGMQVAAEGLETQDQVTAFRDLSCELGQGYFFSRALDAGAAGELVEQHRAWAG